MTRGIIHFFTGFSLRNKIVALIAFITAMVLLGAGTGTISILENQLLLQVDNQLKKAQSSPMQLELSSSPSQQITDFGQELYTRIYTLSGDLIASSGGNFKFDQSVNLKFFEKVGRDNPFDIKTAGGQQKFRAVLTAATTSTLLGERNVLALYAISTTNIDQVIALYRGVYIWFSILISILGVMVAYLIVGGTLSQLRAVGKTAMAFANGDYSQRIRIGRASKEVAQLNQSINKMLDQLDKAMADRTHTIDQMRRLLGDASHELRTPLVSLRGYAELYRMGALKTEEEVRGAIGRIEAEAIRMGSIVEDLMSLARLDRQADLYFEPVDLAQIAEDAAMDATARDPERQIRADIVQDGKYEVSADENKIRQLLTNLIQNAIRYTPKDSPIEIVLYNRGAEAVMDVQDHGPGIPEQFRQKVFERFWRVDNSRARETGGNGLGLAIVLSIVRAHSGGVEILETPGGGATFRVALPRIMPPSESPEELSKAKAKAAIKAKAKAARAAKPKKSTVKAETLAAKKSGSVPKSSSRGRPKTKDVTEQSLSKKAKAQSPEQPEPKA